MTTEEFSNEFDTLVDSYRRFKKFDDLEMLDSLDFNEYEKSVFLTQALEELVKSFYNGLNSTGESFEKTEEIRRYLSNLVKTATITDKAEKTDTALSDKSVFFTLPDDLWFITYEQVKFSDSNSSCLKGKSVLVLPVTLDDYYRVSKNPFRLSNTRRALRLDIDDNTVEVISDYDIASYLVRYVKKPSPIILAALPSESINNVNTKTECELNPAIHRLILEEAVRMAIASKVPNAGNNNQTK